MEKNHEEAFNILSWHLPDGIAETCKDSAYSIWDFNQAPSKHKSRALLLLLPYSLPQLSWSGELIILLVWTKKNFAQFSFLTEFYQSSVSPLKPLSLSSARSLAIHISVLPTWSVMSEVRLGTVNHNGPYTDFLLNVSFYWIHSAVLPRFPLSNPFTV
jgi:hypothetical protein